MSSDSGVDTSAGSSGAGNELSYGANAPDDRPRRPRVWIPVLLVCVYWAAAFVLAKAEVPTFYRFLTLTGLLAVVLLTFLIWWLCQRRVSWRERFVVLAAALVAPVVGVLVADKSLGPITVTVGLPIMFTAWAAWMLVARGARPAVWRNGILAAIFLAFLAFGLFRMEGLTGNGDPDLHWRWSTRPGDAYLAAAGPLSGPSSTLSSASRPTTTQSETTGATARPLSLRPGDWPGFRGPGRDGVVRGVTVSTDWEKQPPKLLWRTRVGPGWSSVAVVDGRAFTQEQRGNNEAVVCRDAASGSELWVHEEPGRFSEALSAVGPRATPTFENGRIYAQGAAGLLVCLDAATGAKVWSRDVLADAGAKLPDWGVCSSPLVSGGTVVVFAAGQSKKGLLGYRADTGEVAWSADAGMMSYSSPHPARFGGREQVLFIGDQGLQAVDPAAGTVLWSYAAKGQPPRSLQPMPVGDSQLLVPLGMEVPTDLVEVTRSGDTFATTKRWTSRNLKPSFNDFVVRDGFIYGFDQTIFSCVDLKTGERKWKKGRYGTGQVVLLADQGLLLVTSDKGEAVLLAAKPDAFEELGQFQAINGKTWNHPAVAQGRLYVRNSEEMACYELTGTAR